MKRTNLTYLSKIEICMYQNPFITGIPQYNASPKLNEHDESINSSDSDDYSSSESSISSRKEISNETKEIPQNQFLPNPNAQFSRSDLRNSNTLKRKQLQNKLRSGVDQDENCRQSK